MSDARRMALVLVSDADDRLAEAATFVSAGAATGMIVHVLITGPALALAVGGRLPADVAARLADARDVGDVRLYGCSAALARLGLPPAGVTAPSAHGLRLDAVLGVPTFLEYLAGAHVQLVF